MRRSVAAAVLIALPAVALSTVRLNEVMYDPAGADGGREFVELHNGGAEPVCLDDLRLQFANGAVGDVWQGRWTGSPGDTLAPGGFFLVVDQGWEGAAPDTVASLGLQNGPDAVRLSLDGTVLDLLGYGALASAALYEGLPHPGAAGGGSLARRPDGHDTDRNDLDWSVLAEPTPGAPNYPAFGLEITTFCAEPASMTGPGGVVDLALDFVASGLSALPAGEVFLVDGAGAELASARCERLPPEAAGRVFFVWRPTLEGKTELFLDWPLAEPDGGRLVVAAGRYMSGLPPLVLTEVMAAPPSDGCEWIEVLAAGVAPVELGNFFLRDTDGEPRSLPPRLLTPGERVVLVQSSDAFAAWWENSQGNGVDWPCPPVSPQHFALELPGAWPTLNNTPPADRDYVDRVHLMDAEGTVLDHVTFGWAGAEVPAGRSLERSGLVPAGHDLTLWRVCTATVGATPGCKNALEASVPIDQPLIVAGNAGDDSILFIFQLYARESAWRLEIYDLTGHRIRDLGGDALGA
ncbi:lamin tail domain-containing protein, partial [bacterium]|nr:lamin tail domain-containing protein [bacterium]